MRARTTLIATTVCAVWGAAVFPSIFPTIIPNVGPTAAVARTWQVPLEAPTVQAGIDSAAVGDVVEVACGIYYEHDIVMKSAVTLRSATGEPDCVTIDAQQAGRVILCEGLAASTVIEGLTITGGLLTDVEKGGGILCRNAPIVLTRCHLVANEVEYRGGGLVCDQSALQIIDCVFEENAAEMGGGGMICYECSPQLSGCSFIANSGVDGAGLFCQEASPRLEFCSFIANDCQFFGGAVFCHVYASPHLINCTLAGNDAHLGSGIMTVYYSYPVLENCIIAHNTQGEGVLCYDDFGHPTLAELICCNVYGNEGGNYAGWIEDQTGQNGNISDDPLFCDLAGGDITIARQSPCAPDYNDCEVLLGSALPGCDATAVPEIAPATVRLAPVTPNPFNPQTTVRFTVGRDQHVTVAVHDLAGRTVAVLADRVFTAGEHAVVWDGRDDAGRDTAAATYVVRLRTEAGDLARKATLVR